MLGRIDQNTNVYKHRTRIPEFRMLGSIKSQPNVYKNRGRIPMFERIRSEFKSLQK